MTRIIKNGQIVNDDWQVLRLAEGQAPAEVKVPAGKVLVPLAVWRAHSDELVQRKHHGNDLGVWLAPEDDPAVLLPHLQEFAVIGIDFPVFRDGRGYSSAFLLRSRYGYKGELRAIGDVLKDQMFYLARVGFDAFAVREDKSIDDALASLKDFSEVYQGSVDQPVPYFRRRAA